MSHLNSPGSAWAGSGHGTHVPRSTGSDGGMVPMLIVSKSMIRTGSFVAPEVRTISSQGVVTILPYASRNCNKKDIGSPAVRTGGGMSCSTRDFGP